MPRSYYPVHLPRNKITNQPKRHETGGDAEEPGEVALDVLPGHPDVHAPHAGDDVHRQHDGAENGELAEDVGVHFGALVHANVDLGDVVAVGAAEEAVKGGC